MEQRNHTIGTILDRLDQSKNDLSMKSSFDSLFTSINHPTNVITLATAVRVLQAHERARQGRVHAYFMHQMKRELKTTEAKSTNDNNLNDSCVIIQTIWRQKYAEKLFHKKKIEEAKLLGMVSMNFINMLFVGTIIRFSRLCINSDFTWKKSPDR
jgi:hypothetical protein